MFGKPGGLGHFPLNAESLRKQNNLHCSLSKTITRMFQNKTCLYYQRKCADSMQKNQCRVALVIRVDVTIFLQYTKHVYCTLTKGTHQKSTEQYV